MKIHMKLLAHLLRYIGRHTRNPRIAVALLESANDIDDSLNPQ